MSTHPLKLAELLSAADMAGLVKAKKYDWKDSNLALFGSDTERNVSVPCPVVSFAHGGIYRILSIAAGEEGVCADRASLEGRRSKSRHPDLAYCQV